MILIQRLGILIQIQNTIWMDYVTATNNIYSSEWACLHARWEITFQVKCFTQQLSTHLPAKKLFILERGLENKFCGFELSDGYHI